MPPPGGERGSGGSATITAGGTGARRRPGGLSGPGWGLLRAACLAGCQPGCGGHGSAARPPASRGAALGWVPDPRGLPWDTACCWSSVSLFLFLYFFFLMCEVTRPKMEAEGLAARRPPAPCEVGIRSRGSARAQRCFCSEVRAFVVPVQQELQPCKPPQFLKGKPVSCLGYYRNASGPSKPSEGLPALCRWRGRAGAAL